MKFGAVLLALALGQAAASRSDSRGDPTPISRVVKLLKGLSMKAEVEFKAEEKLYERFVCWGEKVIDTKSASNAEAKARKESLESYIEDIKAGRIEFTGERASLEKELQELGKDIDNATEIRNEENMQFKAAESEMEQALEAVSSALEILAEVVDKHADGTAFAQRSNAESEEGFAARAKASANLQLAAKLGAKVLSAGDAQFLKRLLTGEVADPAKRASWKKLNRKATHKMSYKSRSSKIVGTLEDMKATFEKNLEDARKREADTLALFEKLMEAKNSQKDKAQEALRQMAEETGARSMSQTEAQDEVDALTEQMEKDDGFIEQVEEELRNKKTSWKERKELRTQEIAAFSKAIAILYNDDARDLMKKSYASQGYFFLQEERSNRITRASKVLKLAAKAAGDSKRLAAFAERIAVHSRGPFTEVMGAIDEMVSTLKDEEQSDLEKKEQCEKNRMEDTREAAKLSRAMDEASDVITRLQGEIADIVAEINEKNSTKASVEEELAEATKQRADEHAEWEKNEADDKEMASIVQRATEVLQEFYTSKNLMLSQQKVKKQEPTAAPGEAPIAPPSTWDGDYKGQTQQATGIIAALENAKADIEKDAALAEANENEAETKFQEFKTKSESQIGDLDTAMSELTGTKGEKEGAVNEQKSDRLEKSGTLGATMESISASNPGCIYMTVNYPIRLRNRQIEIDGLSKAKAILAGAKFDGLPDPDRELRPGDALFLQRRWKQ